MGLEDGGILFVVGESVGLGWCTPTLRTIGSRGMDGWRIESITWINKNLLFVECIYGNLSVCSPQLACHLHHHLVFVCLVHLSLYIDSIELFAFTMFVCFCSCPLIGWMGLQCQHLGYQATQMSQFKRVELGPHCGIWLADISSCTVIGWFGLPIQPFSFCCSISHSLLCQLGVRSCAQCLVKWKFMFTLYKSLFTDLAPPQSPKGMVQVEDVVVDP